MSWVHRIFLWHGDVNVEHVASCNKYKWDRFEPSIIWKLWWKKIASGTGFFDCIETVLLLEETGSRVGLRCHSWLRCCWLWEEVRSRWRRCDSGLMLAQAESQRRVHVPSVACKISSLWLWPFLRRDRTRCWTSRAESCEEQGLCLDLCKQLCSALLPAASGLFMREFCYGFSSHNWAWSLPSPLFLLHKYLLPSCTPHCAWT